MRAVSEGLRQETPDIRVTVVCPGLTDCQGAHMDWLVRPDHVLPVVRQFVGESA
ncbi:hypothetical protein [Nonomuraea angiospora]